MPELHQQRKPLYILPSGCYRYPGIPSFPRERELMGFLGIGNNPMVGCTVACAVDVAQALAK